MLARNQRGKKGVSLKIEKKKKEKKTLRVSGKRVIRLGMVAETVIRPDKKEKKKKERSRPERREKGAFAMDVNGAESSEEGGKKKKGERTVQNRTVQEWKKMYEEANGPMGGGKKKKKSCSYLSKRGKGINLPVGGEKDMLAYMPQGWRGGGSV